jgi:hypothetical protein
LHCLISMFLLFCSPTTESLTHCAGIYTRFCKFMRPKLNLVLWTWTNSVSFCLVSVRI